MKRFLISVMALVAIVFLTAPAASATPPLSDITAPVTDQVDAVDDQEVQYAIQKVEDGTDFRLSVVFVDSFDGSSGAMWATKTAEAAGLDPSQDILFAVATGERKYGSAYPNGTSIARDITSIEDAAVEHLRNEDWTGAAVAYADSVIDVANGGGSQSAVSAPSEPVDFSGFFRVLGWIALFCLGVPALLGLGWLVRKVLIIRSKKVALKKEAAEKSARVPNALIDIDEGLKNFDMEIEYFNAEFPDTDLKVARGILSDGKRDLRTAFAAAEGLTDTKIAVSERIGTADTVLSTVAKIQSKINNQMRTFESLREQAREVDASLSSLNADLNKITSDLDNAQRSMDEVRGQYSTSVFKTADKSVAATRSVLTKVSAQSKQAADYISEDKRGRAVSVVETAISTLDGADTTAREIRDLLSSLREAPKVAENAQEKIVSGLAFLKESPERSKAAGSLIKSAQGTLDRSRSQDYTSGDPLSALSPVLAASEQIQATVNGVKKREQDVKDAIKSLPGDVLNAQNAVRAARHYKSNHSRDLNRFSDSNLNSLERKIDKAESVSDPVEAVRQVKKAQSEASQILSDMEAAVRKAKRKREDEERAARRRRESSYGYGAAAGAGYAYGSYDSSSSSSSYSSFGSSGGDFGGSGGSGGDF